MFLHIYLLLWTFLRAPSFASGAQRLTIDTQLGTSSEDCFDRISIGDQLSNSAIYRNITELTTRECENTCKQDKQCQTYDYGVGAKGNATCDLSKFNETTIKEQNLLLPNPDYDIYVRRIQCEQAPPRPLLLQHDEVDNGNRPVIRPNDEDRMRPGFGPRPYHVPLYNDQFSDRPDDYYNNKPDYNSPPSYGDHRPQGIIPLRPDRPYQNQSFNGKPDNYDVLHFNDPYSRPPRYPGNRPESPYIQYIPRPNEKPYQDSKPQDDPYSVIPLKPNPNTPMSGSYGLGHPNGPIGPPDMPPRPNRPNYGYPSPQSSGYGDNSVQVIIRDPPRPPNYGHGCDHTYGPGGSGGYSQGSSYSSQSSYSQSQSSNSQFYGTITEIDANGQSITHRPTQNNIPLRPNYGNYGSNNGGSSQNFESNLGGYGSKGSQNTNRPNYSNNQNYSGNQGSYNSQSSSSSSQSYGGGSQLYYGSNRPYGDQSAYGGNQGSYGVYGGSQLYSDTQNYEGSQGYMGGNRPSSGSYNNGYSGQNNHNGYQNAFGNNQYYANNQGYSYNPSDNNKPYNNRPFYGGDQYSSGYGTQSYGSSFSSHTNYNSTEKPGNNTISNNQTHLRPDRPYKPSNSDYRPDESGYQPEKPGYTFDWPSYKPEELGYIPQNPGYGPSGPTSGPSGPAYGPSGPTYGTYRPDYRPSRPDNRPNESGYIPNKPGNVPGRPGMLDYKPVYENESDKPNKGPGYDIKPDGHVVVSMPISISDYGPGSKKPGQRITYEACFRRVLAGRRALRSFVRRLITCERLEDCRYECATEKRFPCESFNYKLDTTFRGKGLCELMTKPIEAFDVRRDFVEDKEYDFYEVDRNSLEPHCPITLRGPGMLHSGFLSSNPAVEGTAEGSQYQSRWRDRLDWSENRYNENYDRFYSERRGYKDYNRRGYYDRFYVPHQFGRGGSYGQENRGQYDGYGYSYGAGGYGTYYKDKNDYNKSLSHWKITGDLNRYHGVRPYGENTDFNYYDLGRRHGDWNQSNGSANWKIDRWNKSQGGLWNDSGYGGTSYYIPASNYGSGYNSQGGSWNNLEYGGASYYGSRKDSQEGSWNNLGYGGTNYYGSEKDAQGGSWNNVGYGGTSYYGSGKVSQGGSWNNLDNAATSYYGSGKDSQGGSWNNLSNGGTSYYESGKESQGGSWNNLSNGGTSYYGSGKESQGGSWNNLAYGGSSYSGSGNNYYYDETGKSYYYYEPNERSDGEEVVKDCSSRRRPGMSLSSGSVRRSLSTPNVVECEAACFTEKEFKCVSYSYRYSSTPGGDNCYLSERPYRGLELAADSGSDVYAMPQDQGCTSITFKPWVESECFWHVRSGSGVSGDAVRAALTVAGLGACEAECIRAQTFFCRGFSFRFDAPVIGDDLENCLLTSSPPTSLEVGQGLRPITGHELYARGNYGRGCEPALYDDVNHKETSCYLQYDKSARLIGTAVRGQARVRDEEACGAACTDAPFRCLSYSFSIVAPSGTDNCLLSEIRLFDLQRGVDYQHSDEDFLFAFDLFNGHCWRKFHGENYDDISVNLHRPSPPASGDFHHYSPGSSGPSYIPESEPSYVPGSPGHSPDRPIIKPVYPDVTGPGFKPGYTPSGPDIKPGYPTGSGPDYIPGYSPSGPDIKPGYPSIGEPGHRPGYRPTGPETKPSYPTGPDSRPSYPGTSRPGYSPSGPSIKPGYPGINGPVEKPGYYPGTSPDSGGLGYGHGYIPDKPGYRPIEPNRPIYRPGYVPDRPDNLPSKPNRPGYLPERPVSYPSGPSGPHYRPGYSPSGPSGPEYRPGYPSKDNRPFLIEHGESNYSGGEEHYGYREDSIIESWRHYSVSGFPCRRGTSCAQNQVAGHWACEPEGGEIGSWDYCCAPTHRCGYSEGFSKPWCYVGPSEDQWRPCSEKYYPYHQHNVPHPSLGTRGEQGYSSSAWQDQSSKSYYSGSRPYSGPYLSLADRRYWDELYRNGPQSYYDKNGNPLPGYVRVSSQDHSYSNYHQSYSSTGQWAPVAALHSEEPDPSVPGSLGAPRYWPVAYLHKGPPPNKMYFRYNEMKPNTTNDSRMSINTTPNAIPETGKVNSNNPKENNMDIINQKDDMRTRSLTRENDKMLKTDLDNVTITTPKQEIMGVTDNGMVLVNNTNINNGSLNDTGSETVKRENLSNGNDKKIVTGISGKLDDFDDFEVFNIEDAKSGEKYSDLRKIEEEEKQIAAIGRLLASKRRGRLLQDKGVQKDLESKNIAVDRDTIDFDFGNRFPTPERKGTVQKVTKQEIENERNNDKSLEVSETTFVRPPRFLNTPDNIKKAIVNGKVFYDATIREARDVWHNKTRLQHQRYLEESKGPRILTNNTSAGRKKTIRVRNVNPVRRVRRVYRKKYNPEEVRKRLLEREKNMKKGAAENSSNL